MTEDNSTSWEERERPGCVTAYAVLLWIGSALSLIGALCLISSVTGITDGGVGVFELILLGAALVLAGINVAAGIGLWQMKKWGWALVVVIQGLNFVLQLLSMGLTLLAAVGSGGEFLAGQPSVLCGNLIGALVSGFILYWFITNRELFNGGSGYKSVVGPDGEIQQEPVKKSSDTTMLLAVGGGLVLVLVLVCVVVIAVLAILGPEVGNVFSQITFELENPSPAIIPWLR